MLEQPTGQHPNARAQTSKLFPFSTITSVFSNSLSLKAPSSPTSIFIYPEVLLSNLLKLKMDKNLKMTWSQKWEITVMPDTHTLIRVIVSADCFTSELFEKIRNHPQAPKSIRYQLTTSDALEVQCSSKKRLSDYAIKHGSTLSLVVGLLGGVWPTEKDLEDQPRNLIPSGGLKTTPSPDNPDILGLDDSSLRAVMPCGHAIAPLSLALHCYYELEKGEHEVLCPDAKCRKKWTFALIRDAACLTPDELQEFERRALLNRLNSKSKEMKPCPKCSTFSSRIRPSDKRLVCGTCTYRLGRNYEFCWLCLREWKTGGVERCGNLDCANYKLLFAILANCPDKEIIQGTKSPSKRACPKCFTIIEHLAKCKNMTCSMCKYEFCFICLNPFPCGTDTFSACTAAPRQRSATFKACTVSPRQTSVTEPLRTTLSSFGRIFYRYFNRFMDDFARL